MSNERTLAATHSAHIVSTSSETWDQAFMPQLNNFGKRLKHARTVLNSLSMQALADAAGVSRTTIHHWEKLDDASVFASSLNLACQALRVPLQWVVDGTGPMTIADQQQQAKLQVVGWEDVVSQAGGNLTAVVQEIQPSPYMPRGPRSFGVRLETTAAAEFNAHDTVIVDPDATPTNGQYLLYMLDNELTIVTYIELPGNRRHISTVTVEPVLQQYQATALVAVINGKWYP